MGSPDFAVPALQALAQRHDIIAVYTQPPRPAGRGRKLRETPVAQAARTLGLEVFWPGSLKGEDEQQRLRDLAPDALVVVAYGLILPQAVLDIPRFGAFNLHASLLPRWRGAAPIQRAIMAADERTGVCVMKMDAGLDTGDVCGCLEVAIDENTTAGELHDVLAREGARLLSAAMDELAQEGALECIPQPSLGITYAEKIGKHEARIDLARPARMVLAHIHGLSPYPGAWLELPRAGRASETLRVRILKAELAADAGSGAPGEVLDDDLAIACGEGAIRPLLLQREGKAPMPRDAFLRGFPVPRGTRIAPGGQKVHGDRSMSGGQKAAPREREDDG